MSLSNNDAFWILFPVTPSKWDAGKLENGLPDCSMVCKMCNPRELEGSTEPIISMYVLNDREWKDCPKKTVMGKYKYLVDF